MEGGGLVERDADRGRSRIVGALMILAVIPALMLFVGRDLVDRGSKDSAGAGDRPATPSVDPGPAEVSSAGAGTCTLEESGVLIEGPGMTACSTQQWESIPHTDPKFGAVVDGIDAGATAIIRLRESGGERIEVAIGRSSVVIRQLDDGVWSFISSTERPPRDLMAPNRVAISIDGRVVSVTLDGRFQSAGITTVLEPGSSSVGAALRPGVAVRFASIELSDAA